MPFPLLHDTLLSNKSHVVTRIKYILHRPTHIFAVVVPPQAPCSLPGTLWSPLLFSTRPPFGIFWHSSWSDFSKIRNHIMSFSQLKASSTLSWHLKWKPSHFLGWGGCACFGPCLSLLSFLLQAQATLASTLFIPKIEQANSCLEALALAISSARPLTPVLYMAHTLSFSSQLKCHLRREACHGHPSVAVIKSPSGLSLCSCVHITIQFDLVGLFIFLFTVYSPPSSQTL